MADTHALWWFLKSPERLSAAATAVFRLAATGNATIVVPSIAVAEFYFLSVKLGQPIAPAELLARLDSVGSIECPTWAEPNSSGWSSARRFLRCTIG